MENLDTKSYKEHRNAEIKVTKDCYVLVEFKLEKRSKFYLGQVLQLFGKNSDEVKFLRHKGGLLGRSMTCRL